MKDETEVARREMIELGTPALDLLTVKERWTTDELRQEFEVISFLAPFVTARRKSTGKTGSLEFTHSPRFYFNWQEDV